MISATHQVPDTFSGPQRLSDYLCGIFAQLPSRKSVKNAIKSGLILVDGSKGFTGDWVKPGQKVELIVLDTPKSKVFELELKVLFEDDYIAVINKPSGIAVNGNHFRTVENALLFNIKVSDKVDAFRKPRPVHRLDAPTSGLLLIAKTKQAAIALYKQFEERKIQKRYQAIVIGKPPQKGSIDQEIDGKQSLSKYELIRRVDSLKNKSLSLLNLYPHTGRTHQLRIHLSQLGYPVLGDKLYGKEGMILKHKGLFLAAVELQFIHPVKGIIQHIIIDSPYKFHALLDREQRRFDSSFSGK